MSGTFVLVGCGAAKADEPQPAKDLYTSNYFALKRRFAEAATAWAGEHQSSTWMVLSAEHGIIPPELEYEPYDTTVDDLDGEELDQWAKFVRSALTSWLNWPFGDGDPRDSPCGRLIVLAGESYIQPLDERDVWQGNVGGPSAYRSRPGLPCVPEFPFREGDFGGIGEQMAWLKERAVELEADGPTELDALSSVGGGYERDRPPWQGHRKPINAEDTEQASIYEFEDVPPAYRATTQQRLGESHPLATDGGQAAVSHGPCVKHRCCSCHRIFDSVMQGADCPHCSARSICSSENSEKCQ